MTRLKVKRKIAPKLHLTFVYMSVSWASQLPLLLITCILYMSRLEQHDYKTVDMQLPSHCPLVLLCLRVDYNYPVFVCCPARLQFPPAPPASFSVLVP